MAMMHNPAGPIMIGMTLVMLWGMMPGH